MAADGYHTAENAESQTGTDDDEKHLTKVADEVLKEVNIGSKTK